MSKSYNNTIGIFEPEKDARKKIMRIKTDARPMEEPKEPEGDHLFQLYQLMASESEIAEMAALYRKGGFGYGQIKTALADVAEKYFQPARQRRAELERDPDLVGDILADGARRARSKAAEVLARVEAACGISR